MDNYTDSFSLETSAVTKLALNLLSPSTTHDIALTPRDVEQQKLTVRRINPVRAADDSVREKLCMGKQKRQN